MFSLWMSEDRTSPVKISLGEREGKKIPGDLKKIKTNKPWNLLSVQTLFLTLRVITAQRDTTDSQRARGTRVGVCVWRKSGVRAWRVCSDPGDCSAETDWGVGAFRKRQMGWRLPWCRAVLCWVRGSGSEGGAAVASAAPALPAAATGPTLTACWLTGTHSLLELADLLNKRRRKKKTKKIFIPPCEENHLDCHVWNLITKKTSQVKFYREVVVL